MYKLTLIKAESEVTVYLSENAEVLDEVVVVGYSTEKKSDLTGSVSVVKMKDVADTPTGNVFQALQGRVAGMNITTDGTPGGIEENAIKMHPARTVYDSEGNYNDQMAADLLDAAEALPESQSEIGRINSRIAKAYAAKVKLYQAYEQDPQTNAVTNINKTLLREVADLIDGIQGYDLLDDFQQLDMLEFENGRESVFAIQFSKNISQEENMFRIRAIPLSEQPSV